MPPPIHKATTPLIIEVDDTGPQLLTPRNNPHAQNECLLVIYPRPTLRQARIQLWMSLQMFFTALRSTGAGYFRRINRGHNSAYRQFPATQSESNHRSSHNGHA